ncbi:uncharacterized protein OCT59_018879 [Rhizophagus irregularis]|uniref:uncharacterized protein n=1 Tax=Rhizophagus irregularis TaxID=588596 RepID=UPI003326A65C|nr:hypothetical protein OCT59_018879 [Rhizophagus irregularis]
MTNCVTCVTTNILDLKIETSPDSLDELFLTLKKRIGNSLGDLGERFWRQFFFDNMYIICSTIKFYIL